MLDSHFDLFLKGVFRVEGGQLSCCIEQGALVNLARLGTAELPLKMRYVLIFKVSSWPEGAAMPRSTLDSDKGVRAHKPCARICSHSLRPESWASFGQATDKGDISLGSPLPPPLPPCSPTCIALGIFQHVAERKEQGGTTHRHMMFIFPMRRVVATSLKVRLVLHKRRVWNITWGQPTLLRLVFSTVFVRNPR